MKQTIRPENLPYNRQKQHFIGMDDLRTLLIRMGKITHSKETIYHIWIMHYFPTSCDPPGTRENHWVVAETYIPKYKNIDKEIEDRITLHELYRDGKIAVAQ